MLKLHVIQAQPELWVKAIKGKNIQFTQNSWEACIIRGSVKTLGTAFQLKKMFPNTVKIINV